MPTRKTPSKSATTTNGNDARRVVKLKDLIARTRVGGRFRLESEGISRIKTEYGDSFMLGNENDITFINEQAACFEQIAFQLETHPELKGWAIGLEFSVHEGTQGNFAKLERITTSQQKAKRTFAQKDLTEISG